MVSKASGFDVWYHTLHPCTVSPKASPWLVSKDHVPWPTEQSSPMICQDDVTCRSLDMHQCNHFNVLLVISLLISVPLLVPLFPSDFESLPPPCLPSLHIPPQHVAHVTDPQQVFLELRVCFHEGRPGAIHFTDMCTGWKEPARRTEDRSIQIRIQLLELLKWFFTIESWGQKRYSTV